MSPDDLLNCSVAGARVVPHFLGEQDIRGCGRSSRSMSGSSASRNASWRLGCASRCRARVPPGSSHWPSRFWRGATSLSALFQKRRANGCMCSSLESGECRLPEAHPPQLLRRHLISRGRASQAMKTSNKSARRSRRGVVVPDDACPECGTPTRERKGKLKLPVNGEEITVPEATHLACPKCHQSGPAIR